MNRLLAAFAAIVLVSTAGCSTFTITAARPYLETAAHPEANRDGMVQAARRVLTRMGWQSISGSSGSYRVMAVAADGPEMRSTLSLEVKEHGEMLVWMRTEVRDEQGQWIAPATVCDSYSFARERDIADRVARAEARRRQRSLP